MDFPIIDDQDAVLLMVKRLLCMLNSNIVVGILQQRKHCSLKTDEKPGTIQNTKVEYPEDSLRPWKKINDTAHEPLARA